MTRVAFLGLDSSMVEATGISHFPEAKSGFAGCLSDGF
jgi:hypothetical protein